MLQLMKRDFLVSRWVTLGLYILLIIAHISDTSMYKYVFLVSVVQLFSFDYVAKINRYLIGLPIDRAMIVKGRYVYSLIYTMCFWIMNSLLTNILPQWNIQPMNWPNSIVLLTGLIVCFSLMLFIFYLTSNMLIVILLIFSIDILGIIVSAMGWLDWFYALSDYLLFGIVSLIFSLTLFLLSMRQSENLFAKWDLA